MASWNPSFSCCPLRKLRKSMTFWREDEDDLGVDQDHSPSILKGNCRYSLLTKHRVGKLWRSVWFALI